MKMTTLEELIPNKLDFGILLGYFAIGDKERFKKYAANEAKFTQEMDPGYLWYLFDYVMLKSKEKDPYGQN